MARTSLRSIAMSASRVLPVVSVLLLSAQAAPSAQEESIALQERSSQTYSGCYSSSNPLKEVGTWTYQSTGYCGNECVAANAAVLGLTSGNDCWCGNELPAASSKVDDSHCNSNCTGYGTVMCGGIGYWSVYLTGLDDSVGNVGSSSSSTGSSTTPSSTQAVVTSVAPGTTIIVTQPAEHSATGKTSSSSSSSSGGSNTAAIAAGVVVGIVGFAAIIGGVYYYLRARQRRQAMEDYQRSNQVHNFMRQTSPAHGPSFSTTSDDRLDPFAGSRNSVGSLADHQDYSRRVLRVANPDGH